MRDPISLVELYLADDLLAVLIPGAKPGWCRNALKDGPLAKVLQEGPWRGGLKKNQMAV